MDGLLPDAEARGYPTGSEAGPVVTDVEGIGGEKFVIERRLGEGGTGVVYAAFDRQRGARVALKMLRRTGAEHLLRFKNEFRSLAEVTHPNLVTLYELVFTGDRWCLAMELVDGPDFLSWVMERAPTTPLEVTPSTVVGLGPSGPTAISEELTGGREPVDEGASPPSVNFVRLRQALRQLVAGIVAIHGAGRLHRDLKPSNVLVAPDGRVVVLDFDLVEQLSLTSTMDPAGLFGTPAYMAPEHVLGLGASPASDWYALGVMLYQALVGRLPFLGNTTMILHQKVVADAAPAARFAPDAPADLLALCDRLLRRDPAQRPSTDELLALLDVPRPEALIASSRAGGEDVMLVAREGQLRALEEAFAARRAGRPVVVRVRAASGLGKSALVQHFLAGAALSSPAPLVLTGRCFERESLPYKAFDSLIDALGAHLWSLPSAEVEALLPPEIGALARLFPVLRRLTRSESAADDGATAPDPRELRRRAIAALKSLLGRLCATRPVIAHIDDLQWGDADAGDMLTALLEGGDAPPLLWILSHRSENEAAQELLNGLTARVSALVPSVDVRVLSLEPLSIEESRVLALRVLGRDDEGARRLARHIAAEGAGSPLFIGELVRLERGRGATARAGGHEEISLETVLRARVTTLSPAAQRLLNSVAVAGRPLRQAVAIEASGLGPEGLDALQALQNGNFVRTTGPALGDLVEPYHDRVQETILAALDATTLSGCHLALGRAIEAELGAAPLEQARPGDIEALAYHTRAAGHDAEAARWSLFAARRARELYASRDAIRHYDTALALMAGGGDTAETLALREELAEACRQAGSYDRAITQLGVCLDAAATDEARARLHVARGRAFQERGDITKSLVDLEKALELFGRPAPTRSSGLVMRIAGAALSHLLGGGRHRRQRAVSGPMERQTSVLFTLMRIYFFADRAKLVWAGLTAMNLARRSPRSDMLALAHGYFGALLFGMGRLKRAARCCDRAIALARESGSRLAEGIALGRRGTCAVFANDLDGAVGLLQDSVTALRSSGEMWELKTSLMLQAVAHFLSGRIEPALGLLQEIGDLSRDLGGTMHLGWSLAWRPYGRFLRGELDGATAQAELRRAAELSAAAGDVANRGVALCHLAAVTARVGTPAETAEAAAAGFAALWPYRVDVPFVQVKLLDAAEAAMVALESGQCEGSRKALTALVMRAVRRLLRMGRTYPFLRAPTLRLEARRLALRTNGTGPAARARATALEALRASPNHLWLAAAYADVLQQGEGSESQRAEAVSLFDRLGVRPEYLGGGPLGGGAQVGDGVPL